MIPIEHNDPINAKILAISEDKIEGFVREPFEEIALRSGVPVETVMARIAAMLRAGTVRRVRQTLLATNLADGALVAWKVAPEKIDAAFDYMSQRDPFSGHVVLRSTDAVTPGSEYKLWTTLKVPRGFSLQHHGELLAERVGADHFRLMPAKGIFTLGVGHVRRKTIEPGSKASRAGDDGAGACRGSERARVEGADRAETGVHARRDWPVALASARGGSRPRTGGILSDRGIAQHAENHRTFLDLSRARQALRGRCARHAFQRSFPLGGAGGTRNGSRRRSRAASHPDPLLLARGGTGIPQRQHHGGRARHRQATAARAQAGDRSAPRSVRNPRFLHERFLGRAQ